MAVMRVGVQTDPPTWMVDPLSKPSPLICRLPPVSGPDNCERDEIATVPGAAGLGAGDGEGDGVGVGEGSTDILLEFKFESVSGNFWVWKPSSHAVRSESEMLSRAVDRRRELRLIYIVLHCKKISQCVERDTT